MLGNMADPKAIGPAMAVALLTTMRGAIIANIIFLPMLTKLEGYTTYESVYREITSRLEIHLRGGPEEYSGSNACKSAPETSRAT